MIEISYLFNHKQFFILKV